MRSSSVCATALTAMSDTLDRDANSMLVTCLDALASRGGWCSESATPADCAAALAAALLMRKLPVTVVVYLVRVMRVHIAVSCWELWDTKLVSWLVEHLTLG